MLFLVIAGTVSLVFGILLLFSLDSLKKIATATNKALVSLEERVYNLRTGIGVSALLSAAICFFVAYYLMKTYH